MGNQATQTRAADTQGDMQPLLDLQNEYFGKIREASARGDTATVQTLLAELDRRTREIMGMAADARLSVVPDAPPQRPPVYDNSVCTLDLPLTVYDGDRDTYLALVEDEHFAGVRERLLADAQPYNARKELLKSALKLTPKLAPTVYDILKDCRERLGLKAELEMYVVPDVQFNAFCYPPTNGKYIIGVTSALLEKFERNELAFVIGHEIGHALFQHYRLPVGFLLHHGGGELSPLHAMRLYAWKRNAEISADRVGLLCGRDFDAAARAFFKLSSGVTDNSLSFQLRDYIDQFADLATEMTGDNVDPEDWYSTHPFSPMRLKTLDMFNRSETYLKLTGREGGSAELSEEQLEFEIKKVMSLMEPSYLQESSELGEHMKSFVFMSGYLVAAANGVVEDSELRALGDLLDPQQVEARIGEMKSTSPDEIKGRVAAIADKLNVMLPVVSKLNVIKDLTVIAGADGSIDESELEILYALTSLLHIRPEFVDHVLSSAGQEDGVQAGN
jgi:uncharacterized tellurite resistance protein B-like protein